MDYGGSVLIYDGDCPYCSSVSRILENVSDIQVIPWQDSESQEFLGKQFGETPFAMCLVDIENDVVYAGESAAKELCRRAGLPGLVSELVRDRYDSISFVVGKVSGRERDVRKDLDDVYRIRDGVDLDELVDAAGEPDGKLVS